MNIDLVRLDHEHFLGILVQYQLDGTVDSVLDDRHPPQTHQFERGEEKSDPFEDIRALERLLQGQAVLGRSLQSIQQIFLVKRDRGVIDLNRMVAQLREVDRGDDPLVRLGQIQNVDIFQIQLHRLGILIMPHLTVGSSRIALQEGKPPFIQLVRGDAITLICE